MLELKLITQRCLSFSSTAVDAHQALLFVTVYNPLTWGHRLLSRASQHVFLSSQTLGDLFDAIACLSRTMPEECIDRTGKIQWKDTTSTAISTGSAICIEHVAYGDGQSEKDYSEYVRLCSRTTAPSLISSSKLLEHLDSLPAKNRSAMVKGPMMHDTLLSTLSFRLHKPYWLFHSGNCEHFFVFEHVRCARRLFYHSPAF